MQVEVDREEKIGCIYQCDLCGKISKYRRTCSICNRDTCSNCTFFDPRWMGDHLDTYCKSCFNIGKEYFDRMEEEREKFDILMEEIEQEWKDKAIEAANSTKIKSNSRQSRTE